MPIPKTIRNFNAFIDGLSYFGLCEEGKLPQPKIQTEAHRGSGMDGPIGIDMGLEGLSAEATFSEWDPVLMKRLGTITRLVFRPAAQGDSTEDAVTIIATISGLVTAAEPGDLKPGASAKLKLTWDVREYRLEVNGEVIHDINLVSGKRVVGGIDQNAGIRRAMGI